MDRNFNPFRRNSGNKPLSAEQITDQAIRANLERIQYLRKEFEKGGQDVRGENQTIVPNQ